jgi:hypothetical protein
VGSTRRNPITQKVAKNTGKIIRLSLDLAHLLSRRRRQIIMDSSGAASCSHSEEKPNNRLRGIRREFNLRVGGYTAMWRITTPWLLSLVIQFRDKPVIESAGI